MPYVVILLLHWVGAVVSIVIHQEISQLAAFLREGRLHHFWNVVGTCSEKNLDTLVSIFSSSSFDIFPKGETCQRLSEAFVSSIFEKLKTKPWILREFFADKNCTLKLSKKYKLSEAFLRIGIPTSGREIFIKKHNVHSPELEKTIRLLPSHPEVPTFIKGFLRSGKFGLPKGLDVDIGNCITGEMINPKIIRATMLMITECQVSLPGLVHFFAILLSKDLWQSFKRDNRKDLANLHTCYAESSARTILIKFLSGPEAVTDKDLYKVVNDTPSFTESWYLESRLVVDMIIMWVNLVDKDVPQCILDLWIPKLSDDIYRHLWQGIQKKREMLERLLKLYPRMSCWAIKENPKMFATIIDPETLFYCARRQTILPGRLQQSNRQLPSPLDRQTTAFVEVGLQVMQMREEREFRHIIGLRVDTFKAIQHILDSDPNILREQSPNKRHPSYYLHPCSESNLLGILINYLFLFRQDQPIRLYEPFCIAMMGDGKKLDQYYLALHRQYGGRAKNLNNFKRVTSDVKRVLSEGVMRYIPAGSWCSFIANCEL